MQDRHPYLRCGVALSLSRPPLNHAADLHFIWHPETNNHAPAFPLPFFSIEGGCLSVCAVRAHVPVRLANSDLIIEGNAYL